MKKLDWNWFLGGLLAILGILIFANPQQFQKFLVVLLGISAAAYGVYGLVFTKKIFDNTAFEKTILIRSIVSIVIGVIAIIFPLAIGNAMWAAMVYILVFYLLLSSAAGFYTVSLMKNSGIERKRYIFENLFTLIIAVVLLLINAKNLGIFITRLLALAVFVCGVIIIAIQIINMRKSITVEATVVDEEITVNPDSEENICENSEQSETEDTVTEEKSE